MCCTYAANRGRVMLWWQKSIAAVTVTAVRWNLTTSTGPWCPSSWVAIITPTATTPSYWRKWGCGSCKITAPTTSQIISPSGLIQIYSVTKELALQHYNICITTVHAEKNVLFYKASVYNLHIFIYKDLQYIHFFNKPYNWWGAYQMVRWHDWLFWVWMMKKKGCGCGLLTEHNSWSEFNLTQLGL